jgi:Flp pilus assembly protein TadG
MSQQHYVRKFLSCHRGASALEFAIIGPVFCVLLFGILAWGGYFWMAHAVQQLANDGARVAVGGLDPTERAALAQASLTAEIGSYSFLDRTATTLSVQDNNQQLAVQVAYDASRSPFFSMSALIPMPSSIITRKAITQLGGY